MVVCPSINCDDSNRALRNGLGEARQEVAQQPKQLRKRHLARQILPPYDGLATLLATLREFLRLLQQLMLRVDLMKSK